MVVHAFVNHQTPGYQIYQISKKGNKGVIDITKFPLAEWFIIV